MTTPNNTVAGLAEKPVPCPFCGGAAVAVLLLNDRWGVTCNEDDCPIEPCARSWETEAEAIAAWNRRASPAPSADVGVEAIHPDTKRRLLERAADYDKGGEFAQAKAIGIRSAVDEIERDFALQPPAAPSVSPAVEGDAGELPELLQWWWNRLPHLEPNAAKIVEELLRSIGQCRRIATAEQPGSAVQGEVVAFDFYWLVELFQSYGGNSLGHYHTGFTDIGGGSRTTQDPREARKYASLKDAQYAASKLISPQGEWKAIEHGFERTTQQPAPAAEQGDPCVECGADPGQPCYPSCCCATQPEARGVEGMALMRSLSNWLRTRAEISWAGEAEYASLMERYADGVDRMLAAAPNPVRAEQPEGKEATASQALHSVLSYIAYRACDESGLPAGLFATVKAKLDGMLAPAAPKRAE